jgi:tripeptide aminopeptidase
MADLPALIFANKHSVQRVVTLAALIGETSAWAEAIYVAFAADANWMVRHGVPTMTFGAGQNEPHMIDEWINLDEYDRACALAVLVATMR